MIISSKSEGDVHTLPTAPKANYLARRHDRGQESLPFRSARFKV